MGRLCVCARLSNWMQNDFISIYRCFFFSFDFLVTTKNDIGLSDMIVQSTLWAATTFGFFFIYFYFCFILWRFGIVVRCLFIFMWPISIHTNMHRHEMDMWMAIELTEEFQLSYNIAKWLFSKHIFRYFAEIKIEWCALRHFIICLILNSAEEEWLSYKCTTHEKII